MQPPTTPDQNKEATPPAPMRRMVTEPDFTGTPQSIVEFVSRADFPHCLLGAYIDIQGFAGVVVEIVKESIRVRPPEGMTQRFNVNRLKTLYGPAVYAEPIPTTLNVDRANREIAPSPAQPVPELPPRIYIANPDFTAPVRLINDYASRADFPHCAYGKQVDILGYTGVVVEIVKGSLKIQSPAGITRSYNVEVLRKLHGKA